MLLHHLLFLFFFFSHFPSRSVLILTQRYFALLFFQICPHSIGTVDEENSWWVVNADLVLLTTETHMQCMSSSSWSSPFCAQSFLGMFLEGGSRERHWQEKRQRVQAECLQGLFRMSPKPHGEQQQRLQRGLQMRKGAAQLL